MLSPKCPHVQGTAIKCSSQQTSPFSLSLLPSSPCYRGLLTLHRLGVPSLCPQLPECRLPPAPQSQRHRESLSTLGPSASGNIHFLNHLHYFPFHPRGAAPHGLGKAATESFPKVRLTQPSQVACGVPTVPATWPCLAVRPPRQSPHGPWTPHLQAQLVS